MNPWYKTQMSNVSLNLGVFFSEGALFEVASLEQVKNTHFQAPAEARGSLHRLWTQLLPAGKEAAQLGDYAAANEAVGKT